MMKHKDADEFFNDLSKKKILVLGDVMIDSYIWGYVDRLSPEAPVPVVKVGKRSNLLGGAANVALNIKALGAEPILLSVIGNDQKGNDFFSLLKQQDLESSGIISSQDRITTTKFRVIGNHHQLIRVDEEIDEDLNPDDTQLLINTFQNIIKNRNIDAIIIQDYNKGVLTAEVISLIIEKAKSHNIPVAVDPKKKNFSVYKHIALFKPNLKELLEGSKEDVDLSNMDHFNKVIGSFQRKQDIKQVLVTLSEKGIFISSRIEDDNFDMQHIPAHIRSVADVSGAGDTVISVATLCMSLGIPPYEMAEISNIAGGLVCEHVGVVPIDLEKLKEEIARM